MRSVEPPWFRIGDKLRRAGSEPRDPYVPPPTVLNSTPWLPFDLNVYRQAMRQSPRKAWLHGFLTFMPGGDGYPYPNNDHWDLDRMPGGPVRMPLEADDPVTVTRDWMLRDVLYDVYREQRPIPSLAGVSPEIRTRIWECQQAEAAGFDGEMPDVLNTNEGATTDNRWGQLKDLVEACGLAFPGGEYKIQPMLDGNTSVSRDSNLPNLIPKLAALLNHPAIHKENGIPQVATYMPEAGGPTDKKGTAAQAVSHWTQLQDGTAAAGTPFEYSAMCTQRGTADAATPGIPGWAGTTLVGQQGYGSALAPLTKRLAKWGSRNPVETLRANTANALAGIYSRDILGKPFMPPVSVRDSRPNQRKFEECLGWAQLRASVKVAVDIGADWIQIPTKNDMAEHAHTAPSLNHGWTSYDLLSYYLVWFKLGIWPTILTDTVYITHRVHRNNGFTPAEPGIPKPVLGGSTPEADIVEVCLFLRDTAGVTVEITVGGTTRVFTPEDRWKVYGGDGVYAITVDLIAGPAPSARVLRDGRLVAQVVSKFPVVTSGNWPTYDKDYRSASSGRQLQGAPA